MPAQTIIRVRQDTAANWTSTNPVLAAGEFGYETDTEKFKIGNGTTAWTSLTYAAKLDSSGKIPSSALPDISITDTFVVASEAAMLALTAQTGDVAVRTDVNKSYILKASPASTLANWQELLSTTTNQTLTLGDGLSGTSYNGSAAVTAAVDSTIPRLTASQTFTGAQTLVASGSAVSPLIVRGTTSQSVPLQEWRDVSNNVLFSIPANTTTPMTSSYAFTLTNNLSIFPGYDTNILSVRAGVSNPTFDMLRFRNSIGAHIAGVSATGQIYTGATAILANTQLYSATSATTTVGVVTRGFASQTADLLQTQNSAATNLISVTAGGSLIVNPGTSGGTTSSLLGNVSGANNTTTQLAVIAGAAGTIPFVARTGTSPTVDVAQFQSSTGGRLAYIDRFGGFYGAGLGPVNQTGGYINTTGNNPVLITTTGTAISPLITRAIASQSADIQQWQNSTPTKLAAITSNGSFTTDQDAQFGSTTFSLGGGSKVIGIANAETVPTTNPTGGGVLYASSGGLNWIGTSGSAQTIVNGDGTSPFAKLTADQTFTGSQTLTPSATTGVPLILTGLTGQTGDLLTAANSIVRITSSGLIRSSLGVVAGSTSIGSTLSVTANTASTNPAIIRGAASQTADLLQLQNSAASVLAKFDSAGNLTAPQANLNASAAANVPLTVKAATSQTGSLTEWRDVNNVVLANVSSAGFFNVPRFGSSVDFLATVVLPGGRSVQFGAATPSLGGGTAVIGIANATTVPTSNPTGGGVLYASGGGLNWIGTSGSAQTIVNGDGTSPFAKLTADQTFTGAQTLTSGATTTPPLTVRGFGTSGVVLDIRDSGTNRQAYIAANGEAQFNTGYISKLFAGSGGGDQTARLAVTAFSAGQLVVANRGAASHTADLEQWQNSAATNLVSVTAGGSLIVNPGTSGGTTSSLLGNTGGANNTTANLAVISSAAASIPLVVRAAASQSGNLIQTQSSTGAINFRVESNGAVVAPTINTSNGFIGLLEGQSGGDLRIIKKTSSPGSPGASSSRLYFLDGTISGTLRMVLRSGASGEEQTLFDNIPQTSGTTSVTIDGGSA